ncbi:hypothetical protein Tco_0442107, partial [Tanacetum coccineum]
MTLLPSELSQIGTTLQHASSKGSYLALRWPFFQTTCYEQSQIAGSRMLRKQCLCIISHVASLSKRTLPTCLSYTSMHIKIGGDNNCGSIAAALFDNLEEGGSRDIVDDDHENDESLNSLQD